MYAGLAFQPSQYSGAHSYGASDPGYPCIKKGATDQLSDLAVSVVQYALADAGRSPLTPGSGDAVGNFGPVTDARVRQFQSENGLAADGIVGPLTAAKLGITAKWQSCTSVIQTTAAPVDTGGGEPGFFKKIDIFRQTDPEIFYGGIAMTGLILFAGTAIFLNESGRPSTAAPKKRKSRKRRKSRKGRRR